MRDNSKKQMVNLYNTIKQSGGDIGEVVRKGEQTKEDKMPNSMYMDNPFGQSKRHVDTYEYFHKHDANNRTATDKMNDSKRGKVTESKKTEDIADLKGLATSIKPKLSKTPTEDDVKKYLKKQLSDDEFDKLLSELVSLGVDFKVEEKKKSKVKKFNDFEQNMMSDDELRPMYDNLPDFKYRYSYDVLRKGKVIKYKGKDATIINVKHQIVELDVNGETVEVDIKKLLK
jgi:hypothetical protein